MARTPSKITKRDIDKDLYLEIVSEANNKTNIEKLLASYVRKDEGITEWQLPDKYRTSLTTRLNTMDSTIQDMKNDTTQKEINEYLDRRLSTLEKKEGVDPETDPSASSPIIGTQVAANTSNIAKNAKDILTLNDRVDNVESEMSETRYLLQSGDQKLKTDFDKRLKLEDSRIDGLETSLNSKRSKSDLITADDLDDSVKKNIQAVLNIGSSTISALDNLDAIVQKVDGYDKKIEDSRLASEKATTKVETTKSELLQEIIDRTNAVKALEVSDNQATQNRIDTLTNNTTAADSSLQAQITEQKATNKEQETKIANLQSQLNDVEIRAKSNTQNMATFTDNVSAIETLVNTQERRVTLNEQAIKDIQDNSNKQFGIPTGKILYINDDSGLVSGKNLVMRCATVYNDEMLKDYEKKGITPILDIRTGFGYFAKTAEEIAKETEEAAESGESVDSSKDEYEKKYNVIEGYTTVGQYRNCLVVDNVTNVVVGFIDGDGTINGFYAKAGCAKYVEVELEPGENAEYTRADALNRPAVTVYVMDTDETSATYEKWINSEGVATIAYTDESFIVYNNSDKKQSFHILED